VPRAVRTFLPLPGDLLALVTAFNEGALRDDRDRCQLGCVGPEGCAHRQHPLAGMTVPQEVVTKRAVPTTISSRTSRGVSSRRIGA